ncbi:hypothetical protein LOTGIDRAFT_153361 [Lottia gigantea]|uniref:Endonuclease/exonuclease/phosphatase domain-containing protein n=1 Tax=Lottia gigantea TaxID=225164 RepID=V4BXS2_LOTGI|nr:hypothetical protein LOTGIDRAFT_153361 [Lottia gigantea]ESO93889.1 hypothetical protein LOTGIDRAFT_153361 [Lottia gigantea]
MDNEPLCAEIADEYVREVMANSHTAESDQNTVGKDFTPMIVMLRTRLEHSGGERRDSFKKLNTRIDDLEDNLEKKIVGRISQSINAKIEESVKNRVTEEVTIMKAEISENIKIIEHKIENLKMTREPVDQNVESSRTKNIVIKNLLPCQAEVNDSNLVVNTVDRLVSEVLGLKNIKITHASRIQTRENNNRINPIVATVENIDQKQRIMKAKPGLKKTQDFYRVYIEHDLPQDVRNSNYNLMNILKIVGGDREYRVVGGRITRHVTSTYTRRTDLHRNAKRGSGGVGILVNSEILGLYDALDGSKEDILWLKLSHKTLRNSDLCICACYVPPSDSSRAGDVDTFFNDLYLQQVYCFQNEGILYMAGDFNARCGDEQDFIAGVDDIPGRDIIDTTSNLYGDKLIDFLTSCNLCMLNGRVYGEHGSNNFTCLSKRGKSVVDYAITTHEQLSNCKSCSVYLMSDLINLCGIQFEKLVPDHGPIIWTIDVQNATSNADHFPVLNKTIRYDTRKILRDFLTKISGVEEIIIGLEKELSDNRKLIPVL